MSELAAARQEFQRQSAEAQASIEQTTRDLAWLSILRAEFDGRHLKDCDANRNIVFGWLNPGEDYPTLKLLQQIFQQRPHTKQELVWERPPLTPQQRQQAEQTDREEFTAFCKANRFNSGLAGLNLAQEVLGRGNVTQFALAEAVRSRRLKLAPASADELAERELERQDAENWRILDTPAHRLKTEAAQGILDRRKSAQQEEADRVFAEKQTQDQPMGYPDLPRFFRGELLDRDFFVKKCDRETLKFLNQRYGPANIEARIRGIR